jgi:calcium-dependent protein kinase
MFGQYTLHNKLGDGGYSSVYKCTDAMGVRYACKILPKHKNKRVRVQEEIRIMKMLRESPKIVRFHEAGEDEGSFYIVHELCRGGAVKDYMATHENYGENTVASIVRGTLRGLHHMHSHGVIHRDVKAANILLGDQSEDADVKLGDFGTAVPFELDFVEVEDLVGTPWFMAPENLRQQYHPSSDVWSVGVMTYQLLSGKMPFNDRGNPFNPSMAKIWRSILEDTPAMSSARWDNVSEDAKDFMRTCLTKDYRARPSAKEALAHPWLTQTDCNDRFKGVPLQCKPFQFEDASMMNAKTIVLPQI